MIIACTGHIEDEFINKAWLSDIDEVLPKPVKFEILREIFRDVIINNKKGSLPTILTNNEV